MSINFVKLHEQTVADAECVAAEVRSVLLDAVTNGHKISFRSEPHQEYGRRFGRVITIEVQGRLLFPNEDVL